MYKLLLISLLVTTQAFPNDGNTYCYGDSIAVGYCTNFPGLRKGGYNPAQVLKFLQTDSLKYKGKHVLLSTGVSNNRKDIASIEKQFQLLQRTANKVTIIGAAKGRYDKENVVLAELSTKYGFTFMGGFTPSSDRVHPRTYKKYK